MGESSANILFSLMLLYTFSISLGCFITNCPAGGKRDGSNSLKELRQCESCGGPNEIGRCFGPRICCTSRGCHVGTVESLPCLKETFSMTPCENHGDACSGNNSENPINGRCATQGICCSTDTCTLDPVCMKNDLPVISEQSSQWDSKPQLMARIISTKLGSLFRKPLQISPPLEVQRQLQSSIIRNKYPERY